MADPLRIVQYGLGPIGRATARVVLDREQSGRMALVGALDVDPQKMGRDVASVLDDGRASTGIVVTDEALMLLQDTRPDVVLHTTSSFLPEVGPQLMACVAVGAHVVSSTEELAFPYERHPERADALDRAARDAGVLLVGTGVNPGYAMDVLPLTATGCCTTVEAVRVERVVDAAARRESLQRKIGAGLSPAAFDERVASGTVGHVGLRASLQMIAHGLGWTVDTIQESVTPVVAEAPVASAHCSVAVGEVAGLRQSATGSVEGQERLSLKLEMYLGADAPRDTVRVDGTPPVDLVVDGGICGDTATVGRLVNVAEGLPEGQAGLKTMMDLPVPRGVGTASSS